jgi:hypothetical protein
MHVNGVIAKRFGTGRVRSVTVVVGVAPIEQAVTGRMFTLASTTVNDSVYGAWPPSTGAGAATVRATRRSHAA